MNTTFDDIGKVFPPRHSGDVAAYDESDLLAGFLEYRDDDPSPGENRSPAYRWGWANARHDMTKEDDGFNHIRFAFIAASRPSTNTGRAGA